MYVKIGMVINVYPVGVPGAKKLGQNSLDWGLASSMSSSHKEVLHLTLESLRPGVHQHRCTYTLQ